MKKHGHTSRTGKSKEYHSWQAMKRRCYDKNHDSYKNYGSREITVCDRWRNSFENFLADMGFKPTTKHTLERKDSLGNYTPDNCKWATWIEQANNKCNNHLIDFNGQIHSMSEWARITGISRDNIKNRIIKMKWPIEKALTLPVKR